MSMLLRYLEKTVCDCVQFKRPLTPLTSTAASKQLPPSIISIKRMCVCVVCPVGVVTLVLPHQTMPYECSSKF